jgi:hypothetical protein
MIDPQNFIDRMLEVENLTDTLEDDDADYLLNWGVEHLKEKLGTIEDSEAAGEYTNNLMCFMRKLNQIAGDLENIQPEYLAQLAERRQLVLGAGLDAAAEPFDVAANRLKMMTPRQALEYLLQTDLKEE